MAAKKMRTLCIVCFISTASIWLMLEIWMERSLFSEPQYPINIWFISQYNNSISRNKSIIPHTFVTVKKTEHFDKWQSNIALDFDYITSSIAQSNDIHLSLDECIVCEKINDEYYVLNKTKSLAIIDYRNQLKNEPFLISCSNEFDKSFQMQKPIGIPATDPSFLHHQFKYFCFTHTPGLQLDNTIVNEKYLFRMGYIRYAYGKLKGLQGKKIKSIYQLKTDDNSVRNMIFVASFFGGTAFQHFIPGVIPKLAIIYDLIINQYDYEQSRQNNIKLNITIISQLDIRADEDIRTDDSIQNWVWSKFKKHFHENYRNKIIINLVDVIDHFGWIKTTTYTYWSDMFLMPHVILKNNTLIDHILYPRGLLQPLNWLLDVNKTKNVKPFLILYYDRGEDNTKQRSIKNNDKVIETIKLWVDNTLNVLQTDIKFEFKIFKHTIHSSDNIDVDAVTVSQAILHIGPHGGAFSNLVFAKKDTFVLEFNDWCLKHEHKVRTWFYSIAQMRNMHYYYLCPNDFTYTVHKTLQMYININYLKKILLLIQHKILGDNSTMTIYNMNETVEVTLSVNKEYLEYMKQLPRIPKLIHIIWPDKTIVNSSFNMIEHGVKRLYNQNPDWTIVVHDYEDMNNMFKNTTLLLEEEKQLMKNAHIVEQTAAYRLLMMYEEGGLYIDIDRAVNIPLDTVIDDNTRLVIPTYYNTNFAQDLFASSQYNKLILESIRVQWDMRMKGYNGKPLPRKQGWVRYADQRRMGNSFSGTIEQALFGRKLKGEMDWNAARKAIQDTNNVIVSKKDIWCDGLIVRPYDGCKKIERHTLYGHYNVTPWAGQVKAVWGEK